LANFKLGSVQRTRNASRRHIYAFGNWGDSLKKHIYAFGDWGDSLKKHIYAFGDWGDSLKKHIYAFGNWGDSLKKHIYAFGKRWDRSCKHIYAFGNWGDSLYKHIYAFGKRWDRSCKRIYAFGKRIDIGTRNSTTGSPSTPCLKEKMESKKPRQAIYRDNLNLASLKRLHWNWVWWFGAIESRRVPAETVAP
jgi:hypothetical protein